MPKPPATFTRSKGLATRGGVSGKGASSKPRGLPTVTGKGPNPVGGGRPKSTAASIISAGQSKR